MKWPIIQPGEMRHRITILKPTAGTGASGARVEMTPFIENIRATVEDEQKGTDKPREGQDVSEEALTLKVWYDARIQSSMQVQALGGTYIIQRVIDVKHMGIAMRLVCIALGENR